MKTVSVLLGPNLAFRKAGMQRILKTLDELAPNKSYEVVIRADRESKTLRQLGALFGVWTKHLAENLPDQTIDWLKKHAGEDIDQAIHRYMKAKFLAGVYAENPKGYIQEMWVDRLDTLGELVRSEGEEASTESVAKLKRHAKELSLSWASVDQMRRYMSLIDQYWHNEGYPLPELEKFKKYYKSGLAKPPELYQ